MDKIDFTDKVVIITGASSGVGAATATAFAEFGAKLTIVGRNETRLTAVAQNCTRKNNIVPLRLLLDLTNKGSCEIVVNKTIETYGKIDILVNCAGKLILSSLHDETMDAFDKLMNINFRVPFHLSQLALPYLSNTKGNIINIGSSLTKRFKPGFMPYNVAKSALATFTRHAAPELLTDGVRINTISPGTTRISFLANLNTIENGEQKLNYDDEDLDQDMPNDKTIEPKEVAALICLTASDVFPNLNGSELVLDGAVSLS